MTSKSRSSARSTRIRRRRARRAPRRRGARGPARCLPRAGGSRSGSARRRFPPARTARRPRRRDGRNARTRRRRPSSRAPPGTRPACSRTARGSRRSSSTVSARCVCSRSPWRRASSADSVISRFVTENGEHGATAICTIEPAPASCTVVASRSVSASTASSSSTTESGGRPPVRLAEIHRSAGGDDADAELRRRLHLGLEHAVLPAREDVVVVEDGRAAGERELRDARARRRVLGLGVEPRPERVQLPQPREEVRLLRPRPRERLEQVVVGVDEPRRDDRAARDHRPRPPPAARRCRPPATRPSSTSTHPSGCSDPASSIVTTHPFFSSRRTLASDPTTGI